MKKYGQYKAIRADWLGDVPLHWDVLRARYLFREIKDLSNDGSETLLSVSEYYGVKPRQEVIEEGDHLTRANTLAGYRRCQHGDLVVNIMLAWKRGLGVADVDGIVSPSYAVYRPDLEIAVPRYLHYLLRTDHYTGEFERNSTGIIKSRLRLYSDSFGDIDILLPPVNEQQTIADYLDRKTEEIDTLVRKKQALIDLLREQRTALIHRAVTKGLNPDVPMRGSGFDWIGEMPASWSIVQVKRTAQNERKSFTDGDWVESPFITDEGIRLIQTGNVGIGEYREKGFRFISPASFEELNCTEVEPGDVLICRLDGPVGRACLAPSLGVRMITSVDNAILKPSGDYDARYLVYLMSSEQYLMWIDRLCQVGGGFRFRISRSMLGDVRIPAPPFGEQVDIADYLDEKTSSIDQLIIREQALIDLLQGLRTSLISEVVTGKIDVREEIQHLV